jgi:hypothetical protein
LKRRLSALDSSFTPLSRLLAVAITEKPRTACTSLPSSGMGKSFPDSTVISVSCTSAGMRVSSSTRAILPRRMACTSGLGTSALSDGPWASSSGVVPAVAQLLFAGAAVPWISMVESPLTAADRCSDTHDLAVPGTPYSSSARSVASVDTAISIRRGLPMYLGLTSKPLASLPPIR